MLIWGVTITNGFCQSQSVSLNTSVGYSGLSEAVRFGISWQKVSVFAGPNFNISKNKSPLSYWPGASLQVDYHPDCKGKFFFLYQYLPQNNKGGLTNIHEAYAGYGYRWRFESGLFVNSGIGVGGYKESSSALYKYGINGLSYCTNLSIGYFF
ncbi:MAG: hypothetical protein GC181_03395 [Bacteroidetes bacterium]|nr:hypothetical protein [Bacteroidota bacterium]